MTTSSMCAERDYFEQVQDFGLTMAPARVTLEVPRTRILVEVSQGVLYVKVEGPAPKWFDSVVRAAKNFAQLGPNWDSEGASAVNPNAVASCIQLLAQLATPGTPPPDLLPNSTGNVSIEWHRNGIDLEIEVGPHGPLYAHCENARTNEEWEGSASSTLIRAASCLSKLTHG